MIRIAVQTGGPAMLGEENAYRVIAEAGFDAVDANVDHLLTGSDIRAHKLSPAFLGSDRECLDYFRPWKENAEKYGLENYQAHAPFPSFLADGGDGFNDALVGMLKKTIMGCDYIGCHHLIIHPFFNGYDEAMDPATEWNVNIERYSALIPEAKKYGVTICLENMFTGHRGKIYEACCSNIDTACRYIDTLNEIAGQKCFAYCLDTGHLLLLGKDIKQAMVKLGSRIEAFHVHDNDGKSDQHLAPYMGVLDWDRFVEGLRAIHYDSVMSFETFNVWHVVDHEVCPQMMSFIAATGRMFARRAQQA